MVIFDRYAYDMALDQCRFRVGLPDRVVRWFIALAPRPDVISCMHRSPEGIAARNQEFSVGEAGGQVEALQAFASREPRAVLISTDICIEETRDQVLNALCAFLQTRAAERL
jgi:hypothetical protein